MLKVRGGSREEQPHLFRCARPSGVPRGPATSTGSLASQINLGLFSPEHGPPLSIGR